jgi:hypothetical protein
MHSGAFFHFIVGVVFPFPERLSQNDTQDGHVYWYCGIHYSKGVIEPIPSTIVSTNAA